MQRRANFRSAINNCILLLCDELASEIDKETHKKKRTWIRNWMARRPTHGVSSMLLKELADEDEQEYRNCIRLSKVQFEELLMKINPFLSKNDTVMREAIPVKVKLHITLSYLASGNSYRDLQRIFRVSRSAISKFIPEVCNAIYEQLKEFVKVPITSEELKIIEKGFRQKWNFPGCYGAIDGKHVIIQAPANCGSEFYNYKGTNSIILLAVVDDDYCFWYFNVGSNGKQSDGGVFQQSSIFRALENNFLPDGGFIVGDDAFPLKPYLLKPYSKITLEKKHKIFNYRLSRARRISENAFGILVNRFRIFQKPMPCSLPTVDKIVKACCALHNWLRKTCGNRYMPNNSFDEEDIHNGRIKAGSWRSEVVNNLPSITRIGSNHSSTHARQLRDNLCEYFIKEGAIPWQERMIFYFNSLKIIYLN